MIILKSSRQIEAMRESGRITGSALLAAKDALRPGMTTKDLDRVVHDYIVSQGATPSFLGYNGFPASACISVNDEVIHGIPGDRVLREGDIVSIDVGAFKDGFHGDCADTFPVGQVSEEALSLIRATRQSFYDGIAAYQPGGRIGDISAAIQASAEGQGYSVIREYVGHGVGAHLHEEPDVPNYGKAGRGPRLYANMTIAIEPMVCEKARDIFVEDNGWTVRTRDGHLSAHYENTVLLTETGVEILTPHG